MKKIYLFLLAGFVAFMIGCTNNTPDKSGNKIEKTEADSLLDKVMDGHDVGMSKMGALIRARDKATALLDSLGKLPAKAQEASIPYKAKLDGVLADLNNADSLMNKWMMEFNMDSAVDNIKERMVYLESEKSKVGAMKEAILGSLAKADSVLKQKF